MYEWETEREREREGEKKFQKLYRLKKKKNVDSWSNFKHRRQDVHNGGSQLKL